MNFPPHYQYYWRQSYRSWQKVKKKKNTEISFDVAQKSDWFSKVAIALPATLLKLIK
jgi:hypothetical protein